MSNAHLTDLNANLATMEVIVCDLLAVGKRSELKVQAEEMLRLIEMVGRHAVLLEQKNLTDKYEPYFGNLCESMGSDSIDNLID